MSEQEATAKAKILWGPDAFARIIGKGFGSLFFGEFIVGVMNGVRGSSLYDFESAFKHAVWRKSR